MKWYFGALKKYAVFRGRARRKEFGFFMLFHALFNLILMGVDAFNETLDLETGIGLISGIYTLALFLPAVAVSVRRLHDRGLSGWWFLIVLIPIIGGLVMLLFLLREGQPGTNKYGPNPKMVSASSMNSL